jgi:nicotinamidase-related amidase
VLIAAERSVLLVIDMQEKVLPAIDAHDDVVANVTWLIRAAQKIGVPVCASEHYPKGLGHTTKAIRALLPEGAVGTKNHFSGVSAQCLGRLPGADRPQVVMIGVEAHVCLLQTALELLEDGKEVFVVADCVGSRRAFDRDVALARLRQEGARIVTREMVVFEWLGRAATQLFDDVSREFLRAS